jgi:hypothetical protein
MYQKVVWTKVWTLIYEDFKTSVWQPSYDVTILWPTSNSNLNNGLKVVTRISKTDNKTRAVTSKNSKCHKVMIGKQMLTNKVTDVTTPGGQTWTTSIFSLWIL